MSRVINALIAATLGLPFPTLIRDIEHPETKNGYTTAIIVFFDDVPQGPANCFLKVSETRKVRAKLEPVNVPNKMRATWKGDVMPIKDSTVNIFPK